MKMYYPRSNIQPKIRRYALPAIFLGLALLFGIVKVSMPQMVARVGERIVGAVWVARDGVSAVFDAGYTALRNKKALEQENVVLREELSILRRESLAVRMLKSENERLRALAGRVTAETGRVAAAVIHTQAYAPFDTFVVDVGVADGIREGMFVHTADGAAVGSLVRTLSHMGIVQLFSGAGVRSNAILDDGVNLLHVQTLGVGAGTMTIELPRGMVVSAGDSVFLPDMEGAMLGTVSQVVSEREDAYQKVYVEAAIRPFGLRHVLVDTTRVWEPAEEEVPSVPFEPVDAAASSTTESTTSSAP